MDNVLECAAGGLILPDGTTVTRENAEGTGRAAEAQAAGTARRLP